MMKSTAKSLKPMAICWPFRCARLPIDAMDRRHFPFVLSLSKDRSSSFRRPKEKSGPSRSEEHTSELQSLMRISYAVFCLKKKNNIYTDYYRSHNLHINTLS